MQRYPLQPQMPPAAGYHPQRGFKEQEEHPWRDEGCSRHSSGDGPSLLGHLHIIPLSMNLLSGFLLSSSTANRRPGVPGVTADGWPEPGLEQTGLGAEELGEDGRETRSGTDMREAQADGKNKVLEGPRAFFSQTHLFPCVQDKVTRYMIYLAQRKQLFGGSVGVFRQSCSVSEESHLQTLTASFYPSLSFPYSYLPIRLCCTDSLGSHLVFTSGFTSVPWNCRDCLALRVTPPPLSNPWACFWLSDNVWAKKILQRCAEGVKNEEPTAARGIGEAPLPAQEQTRLLPRDLCQRLRARCSAEPSPCSDQPLSTSSPFLRGLCSPKKCIAHLVLLDGINLIHKVNISSSFVQGWEWNSITSSSSAGGVELTSSRGLEALELPWESWHVPAALLQNF